MNKTVKMLIRITLIVLLLLIINNTESQAKTVTGYIWLDNNSNGTLDEGESLLGGYNKLVIPHIYFMPSKIEKGTSFTYACYNINIDENGKYTAHLPEGEYYIWKHNAAYTLDNVWIYNDTTKEEVGYDDEMSSIADQFSKYFTIEDDTENIMINIGLKVNDLSSIDDSIAAAMAVSVGGKVYDDKNGNGVLDEGEEGVEDVTVVLNQYGNNTPNTNESTTEKDKELVSEEIIKEDKEENAEEGDTEDTEEDSEEDTPFFNIEGEPNVEVYIQMDAQENGGSEEYTQLHTRTDENGNYTFFVEELGKCEIYFIYGGTNQLMISSKYNGQDYEVTEMAKIEDTNMATAGQFETIDLGSASYFEDKVERRQEVDNYVSGMIGNELGSKLSALDKEALEVGDEEIAENTFMRTKSLVFDAVGGNDITNLNLGLRERRTVDLEVKKYVTNVKVTLADGSTLIDVVLDEDGNYVQGSKEGTIFLPGVGVNVILDDEIMHGATMEIKYKIRVSTTKRGFWKDTDETEKFLKVTLYDYLTAEMKNNSAGWEQVTETSGITGIKLMPEKDVSENARYKIYKKEVEINAGETEEIELVATSLMTKNTSNEFTNEVEVVGYENKAYRRIYGITPGNYDIEDLIENRVKEADEARAIEVTVIPPFGGRKEVYIVIPLVVLIGITVLLYRKRKNK